MAKKSIGASFRPPEAVEAFEAGKAKFNAGDFDGAVKDFTTALEKCPNFLEVYGWRGRAHSKTTNQDGVVQAMNDYTRMHKVHNEAMAGPGPLADD